MTAKQKIVVVDDDYYLLDALSIQLDCEGYEVITQENGQKVYEVVKAEKPDCVVLDVMMPGKTGLDVTKELKSDDETKLIPIILLTAKSELDDKIAGFDSGAEDYITKPFDFRELHARIKSQMRLYSSIKEANANSFSPKSLLSSDHNLNLVSWDNSIHTILFTATKSLSGKTCLEIFKCHSTDCPMKLKNTNEDHQELTINPSGLNFVSINKSCKSNANRGNEIVITDRRTTKDIINELVAINEKLTDEILKSNTKNLSKIMYFANLNHELKAPLSAIIGYAEMASKKQFEENSKRYLEIIDKSARNIMSMLMEMLDVTHAEAGKLTIYPELISMSDLIDTVVAILEFNIEQRRIEVKTDLDKRFDLIKVDPNRFKQVILNLISNSIKYNKEGGSVTISSKNDSGKFRLSIKDSGVGIPEENLSTIFESFSDPNDDDIQKFKDERLGLGIKLSKSIVELHNGVLEVESKINEGTTVTISLPYENGKG